MLDGDHKALVDAALPVCARYGLAVAGGYAVKAHGLVERPYPDEAFSRYGARPELIAEVKAWALNWSTEIGLDIAQSESWSDEENY